MFLLERLQRWGGAILTSTLKVGFQGFSTRGGSNMLTQDFGKEAYSLNTKPLEARQPPPKRLVAVSSPAVVGNLRVWVVWAYAARLGLRS